MTKEETGRGMEEEAEKEGGRGEEREEEREGLEVEWGKAEVELCG